jgi:hypothetical protein
LAEQEKTNLDTYTRVSVHIVGRFGTEKVTELLGFPVVFVPWSKLKVLGSGATITAQITVEGPL